MLKGRIIKKKIRISLTVFMRKRKQLNRLLVIGDTIIDEYHYCLPLGKSSKSPTISTVFLRSEEYAGGVLAIANHLEQFAGKVKLITCLGKDTMHDNFINKTL